MKIVTVVAALTASYLAAQTAWTGWNIARAKSLEPVAVGSRTLGDGVPFRMFVAGDSVGAGFGASSLETSVAGRVARSYAADRAVHYRNVSVSGAKMVDLLAQPLPEGEQDLIVLAAGSNDLLRFTGAEDLETTTRTVLRRYLKKTDRLALIGPGVIHNAGADPLVLQPIHRWLRPRYVQALQAACAAEGAVYVDPAAEGEKLDIDVEDTVSEVDHFHLSDEGHRWWAERILDELAG